MESSSKRKIFSRKLSFDINFVVAVWCYRLHPNTSIPSFEGLEQTKQKKELYQSGFNFKRTQFFFFSYSFFFFLYSILFPFLLLSLLLCIPKYMRFEPQSICVSCVFFLISFSLFSPFFFLPFFAS